MTFFQKIFGYRSKLAASSSLSFGAVLDMVSALVEDQKERGVVLGWMAVQNTNSMLPLADSNAVVLLEVCPFESLREGDIVTYRASFHANTLVMHRLNERKKNGWQSIGDGNGTIDPELVTEANFDRRVVGILYAAKNAETDR